MRGVTRWWRAAANCRARMRPNGPSGLPQEMRGTGSARRGIPEQRDQVRAQPRVLALEFHKDRARLRQIACTTGRFDVLRGLRLQRGADHFARSLDPMRGRARSLYIAFGKRLPQHGCVLLGRFQGQGVNIRGGARVTSGVAVQRSGQEDPVVVAFHHIRRSGGGAILGICAAVANGHAWRRLGTLRIG